MARKKHTVITRPVARSERLLVEAVGDETVIYDQSSHTAHALQPLAAAVFTYADGEHTAAQLAELVSYRLSRSVSEVEVTQAIAELGELNLLDIPELEENGGLSRRDALKVFGAVGAGAALVSSVAAPTAFATSTQTPSGDGYLCATNKGDLTTDPGNKDTGWPQPPNWNSNGSPGLDYGTQVAPGVSCPYDASSHTGTCAIPEYTCTITSAPTSSGECGYFSGSWSTSKKTCTGYSSSLQLSSGSCSYGTQSAAYAAPNSAAECSFFDGTWNNSKNTCSAYQPVVAASSGSCKYGIYDSGSNVGYWQCVPCDGTDGYQCCSVVCAPANTGYAWGSYASGTYTNVLKLPSGWYPYIGCGYTGSGTNSYTACASGTGQGTPDYQNIGYYGKYCTYNECGAHGGVGCKS